MLDNLYFCLILLAIVYVTAVFIVGVTVGAFAFLGAALVVALYKLMKVDERQ